MERKEPSLAPEWLKGAGASATGVISQFPQASVHQDCTSGSFHSSQRVPSAALSGNATLDCDSSPHVFSERAIHPSFQRSGNSDGLLEQSGERFSRSRSSFLSSRSSLYRGNGHALEDWNHDKFCMSRERSNATALDFGGSVEKDKDHCFPNHFSLRRQSSEKHIRDALDVPFRHMQSIVRLQKIAGNGGEKIPNKSSAPLISNNGPASSTEKEAFEQNFPSLNFQERLAIQPNSENVVLKNSFADEPLRTDKSNEIGSAKNSDFIENGTLLADVAANFLSQPMPSSTVTEALGSSLNDALKPSKFPVEIQQLEELALRQSIQRVPVKSILPRTAGLSPRDKLKPKAIQRMEPIAPAMSRATQASSQASHATRHQELSPKLTHGKLLVQKNGKNAAVSNVSLAKPGGGTFVPLVTNFGMNVAGKMGTSQSSGMAVSATFSRKPKQLLDRRAVPIVSISVTGADGGTSQQSKELSSTSEDKRVSDHAKNRSAFFNALRRKAAGDGSAFNTFHNKSSIAANKVEENSTRAESVDDNAPKKDGMLDSVLRIDGIELQKSSSNVPIANGTEKEVRSNGLIVEGMQAIIDESNCHDLPPGTPPVSGVAGSEEEEAAFLRSLGWQESAKEGEEALTEEEINAFYEEHMSSPALPSFMRQKQTLKTVYRKTLVGSIDSISSGLSSSDSDSEGELNATSMGFNSRRLQRIGSTGSMVNRFVDARFHLKQILRSSFPGDPPYLQIVPLDPFYSLLAS